MLSVNQPIHPSIHPSCMHPPFIPHPSIHRASIHPSIIHLLKILIVQNLSQRSHCWFSAYCSSLLLFAINLLLHPETETCLRCVFIYTVLVVSDTCSCCCRASSICCCCFSSSRAAMFLCSECAPSSCSLSPLSWFIIINNWSSFSARDSGVPGEGGGRHMISRCLREPLESLDLFLSRLQSRLSKGIFLQ